MARQHLLAHTSNGKYAPAQRDLTRHTHVTVDRATGEGRDHGNRDRDPCGWAILGDGAFRHMEVDVHALEDFHVDPQRGRTGLDVGERGLRRFLHDLAELACHLQRPLAFQNGHLDSHDLAAIFRPGQRLRNADLIRLLDLRRNVLRWIEELLDHLRGDGGRVFALFGLEAGHLARDTTNLALEVAYAGLEGVLADDALQGGRLECQPDVGDAVLLDLARNEIAVGDLELLFLNVAGEFNDLHAVEQRG